MSIDRLKIANGFTGIGMTPENATLVANAIGETIEDATKQMATLKDLELITAKSDARVAEATQRVIIWVAGIGFSLAALMVSLKLFG